MLPTTPQSTDTAVRQAFRDVMAAVASPVAVVTAMDGGRPHGTTVSAFASLSLTPPMVLVSLDERSQLLAIVRRTGRFGLNVLGTHQASLAAAFARSGPDKFEAISCPGSTQLGTGRSLQQTRSASRSRIRVSWALSLRRCALI